MGIPSLKDLKKLATLCRKAGITSFKFYQDGSYEFSLDPTTTPIKKELKETIVPKSGSFVPDNGDAILTEEQLMFWSSDPITDPIKKKPLEEAN